MIDTLGIVKVKDNGVVIEIRNDEEVFRKLEEMGARVTWMKRNLKIAILDNVKVVFMATEDSEEMIKEYYTVGR